MQQPRVNRYLKDKAMDYIDQALGRPVDPMGETYRNHFVATVGDLADDMAASVHWNEYRSPAKGTRGFEATREGRIALAQYLRSINDPWRAFVVRFRGDVETISGKTHSNAKYRAWRRMSDCYEDMGFLEFCSDARVQLFPKPNNE